MYTYIHIHIHTHTHIYMYTFKLIYAYRILKKKPSLLGLVSGCVSGLVVVTPACGYVDLTGKCVRVL